MKKCAAFILFTWSACYCSVGQARPRVCFSPKGKCNEFVAQEFDAAKKSIDIAVYFFTDNVVRNVLQRAATRKVKVRVLVDDDCSRSRYCKNVGETFNDLNPEAKMHHKFAIIDGKRLLLGSMNYTSAGASKNNENLVVLEDKYLLTAFQEEFRRLWKDIGEQGARAKARDAQRSR